MALIIHETSFDRFIPDHHNVYKIITGDRCYTEYPLVEEMKKDFPEVNNYFRFYQTNDIQLRNQKNEIVRDQYFGFSDSSIFKILGVKLIEGMPAISLTEVTISKKTASKYFGNNSPLGAILPVKLNNEFISLSISGIYDDFPANSTLFPQFIANIKLSEKMFSQFQPEKPPKQPDRKDGTTLF